MLQDYDWTLNYVSFSWKIDNFSMTIAEFVNRLIILAFDWTTGVVYCFLVPSVHMYVCIQFSPYLVFLPQHKLYTNVVMRALQMA